MLKKLRQAFIFGFLLIVSLIYVEFVYLISTAPAITMLNWLAPSKSAYMQLYSGDKKIRHKWMPIQKISPHLRRAVILAEDDRFFEHNGIDPEALEAAWKKNKRRGRFVAGGSTITMQLARNLFLSPHKTIWRKFREMELALLMDLLISKNRLLELYLNFAEWGDGIYGAEAAARQYFGKPAISLNREEAAFLAAILPKPKFYQRLKTRFLEERMNSLQNRI